MKESNPKILIKTNKGDIKLELYSDKAPITVKNFLEYVKNGHFKNTIFHRVIDNFMIQGGGFTKDMQQKPTLAPISNEAANGLKNTRGTIAMARTMDINSATAQFFINLIDNSFLDYKSNSPREFGYCVFGKVIDGLDVIDVIKNVRTGTLGSHQDVPKETIEILDVSIV